MGIKNHTKSTAGRGRARTDGPRKATSRRASQGDVDAGPVTTLAALTDLTPDARNANDGTDRGRELLIQSLRKHGAARSVVVDKHGRLIAGNKTHEAALALGLEGVILIKTDGTRLVAVQRTDLDLDRDPEAKELAVADNRIAELGLQWNPEILKELAASGASLDGLFSEKELVTFLASTKPDDDETDPDAEQMSLRAGDVVQLGGHQLRCGESTKPGDAQVIIDRWEAFTGQKAVKVGSDPARPRHRRT